MLDVLRIVVSALLRRGAQRRTAAREIRETFVFDLGDPLTLKTRGTCVQTSWINYATFGPDARYLNNVIIAVGVAVAATSRATALTPSEVATPGRALRILRRRFSLKLARHTRL